MVTLRIPNGPFRLRKVRVERPAARQVKEFGRVDHIDTQINASLVSQGVDQSPVCGYEVLDACSFRAEDMKSISVLVVPSSMFDVIEALIEICGKDILAQRIEFRFCVR